MHLVSVIIPCFNEQNRIRSVLEAIAVQTYPRDYIEVVIAEGLSTDNSLAEIKVFSALYPELNLIIINNPKRKIPNGLNLAIQASHGDIIIRIDAHSKPYPDYIERIVDSLVNGLGENVGGIWEILPGDPTWMSMAIAKAAALPIGVGDAMYRHATRPGYVDTVPFGAFKRELLALIGFFNESLNANEDYEFNARILKSGGRIWLDPKIRSQYYARTNLAELSSQYWRYGYWKLKMLRLFPGTIRWRQVLPPLFILSLFLGIIFSTYFHGFWFIPVIEILLYIIVLLVGSLKATLLEKQSRLLFGIPLAIATMHFSWGTGFLWSMISPIRKRMKD